MQVRFLSSVPNKLEFLLKGYVVETAARDIVREILDRGKCVHCFKHTIDIFPVCQDCFNTAQGLRAVRRWSLSFYGDDYKGIVGWDNLDYGKVTIRDDAPEIPTMQLNSLVSGGFWTVWDVATSSDYEVRRESYYLGKKGLASIRKVIPYNLKAVVCPTCKRLWK